MWCGPIGRAVRLAARAPPEESRQTARRDTPPWIRRLGHDDVVAPRVTAMIGRADDQPDPGCDSAAPLPIEIVGRSTTSGDLDHVEVTGASRGQRGADGDAPAEADDADVLRVAMQQHRKQAEQPLRQHVPGIRRVHLSIDGERQRAGEPPDADGTCRAFPVILEPAGAQGRCRGRPLPDRAHCGAAREQLAVPLRQQSATRIKRIPTAAGKQNATFFFPLRLFDPRWPPRHNAPGKAPGSRRIASRRAQAELRISTNPATARRHRADVLALYTRAATSPIRDAPPPPRAQGEGRARPWSSAEEPPRSRPVTDDPAEHYAGVGDLRCDDEWSRVAANQALAAPHAPP